MCVCLFLLTLLYFFIDFICSKQAAVSIKALEKQLQQKKDFDPIMVGIFEEVSFIKRYTMEDNAPLNCCELESRMAKIVL